MQRNDRPSHHRRAGSNRGRVVAAVCDSAMKVKKVNRYWCDFCGKAGLSSGHMKSHEKHCTMNPNRECRVCKMIKDARNAYFVPVPLSRLVAMLPNHEEFKRCHDDTTMSYYDGGLSEAVAKVLPSLKAAAGDCPACVMAALRQAHIPVPMAEGFSFKDEMASIWADINQAQMAREYGGYR